MNKILNDVSTSVIYMFSFSVEAENEKSALNKAKPIVKRCEDFADALQILCSCDHVGLIDGALNVRVMFNIKDSQNSILLKVSSLFSFAASVKLTLVNQFFISEKPF